MKSELSMTVTNEPINAKNKLQAQKSLIAKTSSFAYKETFFRISYENTKVILPLDNYAKNNLPKSISWKNKLHI